MDFHEVHVSHDIGCGVFADEIYEVTRYYGSDFFISGNKSTG